LSDLNVSDESNERLVEQLTTQMSTIQQSIDTFKVYQKPKTQATWKDAKCLTVLKAKQSETEESETQSDDIPQDYQVFEATVKPDHDCRTDQGTDAEQFKDEKMRIPSTFFNELKQAIEPKAKEHRERQEAVVGHSLDQTADPTNISNNEAIDDQSQPDNWSTRRLQMSLNAPQTSFAHLIADRSRQLRLMNETEEFSG
jgi:hypothetical protein